MHFRIGPVWFAACLAVSVLAAPPVPPDAAQLQRKRAIEGTRKAVLNECQTAAGGDWDAWHAAVQPYRQSLLAAYEACVANLLPNRTNPTDKMGLLFGQTDRARMAHGNAALSVSAAGDSLAAYVAADRIKNVSTQMTKWLRDQGIDLIVLPVPTMIETYPEEWIADQQLVPKDRNVIPHLRKKVLDLSEADVEIVDLYPAFMKLRETEKRSLYMVADKHWTAIPQRLAAEIVAERLSRYPWVKSAKAAKPRYKAVEKPFLDQMGFNNYLTDELRALVEPKRAGVYWDNVATGPAPAPVVAAESPILITGDSFVNYGYPFSGGIVGHLARLTNQPVSVLQVSGNTVNTFQDMFRDRDILKGKKVVIWIMNYQPFGCNWMFPEKFVTPKSSR